MLQDLPERRQHVIESFEIESATGSTVTGEWVVPSGEAIGPTAYDVRRDAGPATRVIIDWLGLIPRAQPGLPPDDDGLIKALATALEGLQDTLWVGAVRAMQPRRAKFPRLKPDTIAPGGWGAADGPNRRSAAPRRRGAALAGPAPLCKLMCKESHMATNLSLDPDLIDRAVEVSGERTKKAAVTRALQEFIARREQKRLLELMGKLEWDTSFDYKAERSRR